ncbi:tyrosine-type recombinase/integrase [Deinococcus marmoris]|uniref:tyrosine-type recombinase/integrase n=1 Tax=Deinococcus marmoris TaxID=249408 RepID=UPI00096AA1E2|nr:site-specific integrase [Deinococcus marmoris]
MTTKLDNWQQWLYATDEDRRATAERGLRERNADLLWSLVQAFLWLRPTPDKHLSVHTLHTYRMGVQKFLKFLESIQIDGTQLPEQQQYVDWLQGQKLASMTVRTRSTAAKHLISSLIWAGLEQTNATPSAKFPSESRAKRQRRPYTEAEIDLLLKLANNEERLIILLGLDAGLKAGEMMALRRQDVLLSHIPPVLDIVSARKETFRLSLSNDLQYAFEAWFEECPVAPIENVLAGKRGEYVEDRLRRLCKRVGVNYENIGIEGLRLSAGARFHRENGDPKALMLFLRISHKRNIKRYIDAVRWLN